MLIKQVVSPKKSAMASDIEYSHTLGPFASASRSMSQPCPAFGTEFESLKFYWKKVL